MRAVAPEVIAGAGSAVLHVAALLWVGPWDPVVAEAPVEISVLEPEPQAELEPPTPRDPRPKPEIRRLPRPHPIVRLARAAEPRERKERERPEPAETPKPETPTPKPEMKSEAKPEEPAPEERQKPQEEQAPDPEARGQAGDRLPEQRPEEIRFARTDAAETKIALNSSAVSDRNHVELEETRAPTSTARGLGDGTSQEERIVLYGDRYAEKRDAPQGLKRGQRTRRARAASVAPAAGELGAAGAGTPVERVAIPVVPAEAWSSAEGAVESAGAGERAGAWLSVRVEAPPPPTPAVKRRVVRPVEEEARAATVPVPVPEPEVAPPEPERPLFFGDDFMNTWSAPELGGEAAINPGEEVPELLAEAKPERTSTEGAAFSSLEVADARLPEGERTRISTRRDPLGVWAAGLDQQLRERLVYPPELRALGVGGAVKVGFRVLPDGRVVDIEIVSSDVPELVVPAVAAVPERTDPLPPERERQYRRGIRVTYTFRFGEPGR